MWLSVLFVWGNLLMFAASQSCGETSKDTASWVRLKPLGQCRDGENMCPYSITLPPLTIQLPKHFRDLDKMARELQSLTLMVNQLREECQECRGRQRPEWSVRTDDGGKAGERIQASRGTVNTRERQHDLHKRVRIVQSTTPNSAGEDTMLISSGTREVNRVIGIPGWNMSQERNMKTSSSGQRAESSGGPQRSNLSHVEMAAESVSEVRDLHLFTGEEIVKELESPRAKMTESPLLGNQDEKQLTNYEKASTGRVGHGMNTSGTLTTPGNIPEISVVTMVSENVDTETKQVSPPNKDEVNKRLHGFPRPMNINRKEGQLNPNIENRLKNPGGMRKVYLPVRDRPVQSTARVPLRTGNGRLNGKTPQIADRRGKIGSGWTGLNEDINRPDVIIKTPLRIVSKKISGEKNPTTSVNAQNNREIELNRTETFPIMKQQDENKEKVSDSGVNQLRTFSHDEADKVNVGRYASIAQYPTAENKGSKKNNNHRARGLEQKPLKPSKDVEWDTGAVLNPVVTVKTVSGLEKSQLYIPDKADSIDAGHTNPDTLDSKSESPFSLSMNVESYTTMDLNRFNRTETDSELDMSVISENADPIANISHTNTQIMDRNSKSTFNPSTDAESKTEMLSKQVNTVKTDGGLTRTRKIISDLSDAIVSVSDTNPQSLDNNHDLSKGRSLLKPEFSITMPNSGEINSSSHINAQTERKHMLRINNTVPLNTHPVKQAPFTNRRDKSTIRGKQGPPVVGQKRMARPSPSGLLPLRSPVAKHYLNHTMNFSQGKQLNPPNLRMVKNVTRVNPNHVEGPERTHPTRGILDKNPKLRKSHVLERRPGNENVQTPLKVFTSGEAKNTSGETENMVGIMKSGSRYLYSQDGPTTSRPKQEFKSREYGLTRSIKPTVAMHTIVDQAHAQNNKTVPTVEALHSLIYFQTENTSQSMETKLFHVTKPKNPGGKRELDTITHGVRDDNVETVLSHDTVNHDSDDNRGRASLQVVGKTEETDRRQRAKPFMANNVGSNQDNAKAPFKVETPPSSSGNILLTVKREGSKRKELNYPTTVDMLYTIKPLTKDKEGPVTQFTTPAASATYFMDQDYVEKVETTPGVKVSDTHVHYRFKNSSEDVESKTLTEKISDHDRGDKQSDLDLQSTGKAGGPSDETMLHPNTADSVQKRAIGSIPLVMDRIKDSTVAKGSAPSTESTQIYHKNSKYSFTTSKSIENNNSYNNGNAYPVAVGRTGDNQRMKDIIAQKTTAEGSSKENKKRPFTGINVEDRDNLETQLLNTCQGQCDQRPTLQPTLSTRRSFETDRDKQQDCSDLKKNMKNGVYSMTPVGSKHASFHVFCDMEASDGGWTLIQRRLDGTISFNRTWDEYKKGFGSLTGEFWLGNDKIHWLTAARAMALRLELEDLDGIKEYAQYDDFYVANESLNYQLTIGEYSGTAGNAMQHSKRFNHNQKYFSTPDRDNDEYPSGNCGAYYSSGWWFDACMAANLNGKYYQTRYKGVRNGIFWGTWHNISNEYYPTNDRQSFKTVRMMIRPRENSVLDV
ncbi:uncharacterized protein fgl2b [Electrophorus electricus]|uniref:uncharacterized protein fgl2b n=1 Tax=Electrophorus electricus TaxID=8005 RepID=UPI0015D06D66|nr:uncharacterized protein fgl2b [Electrophorus electricus]